MAQTLQLLKLHGGFLLGLLAAEAVGVRAGHDWLYQPVEHLVLQVRKCARIEVSEVKELERVLAFQEREGCVRDLGALPLIVGVRPGGLWRRPWRQPAGRTGKGSRPARGIGNNIGFM